MQLPLESQTVELSAMEKLPENFPTEPEREKALSLTSASEAAFVFFKALSSFSISAFLSSSLLIFLAFFYSSVNGVFKTLSSF